MPKRDQRSATFIFQFCSQMLNNFEANANYSIYGIIVMNSCTEKIIHHCCCQDILCMQNHLHYLRDFNFIDFLLFRIQAPETQVRMLRRLEFLNAHTNTRTQVFCRIPVDFPGQHFLKEKCPPLQGCSSTKIEENERRGESWRISFEEQFRRGDRRYWIFAAEFVSLYWSCKAIGWNCGIRVFANAQHRSSMI